MSDKKPNTINSNTKKNIDEFISSEYKQYCCKRKLQETYNPEDNIEEPNPINQTPGKHIRTCNSGTAMYTDEAKTDEYVNKI